MNITITNGTLTATINPWGAELNSLKDANNKEYIWDGDPKFWAKHSPVLFPIVGQLKNNSYLYEGHSYALLRHGFARENVFSVKNQTKNSVVFGLSSNGATRNVYPFDFELELTYTLTEKTLHINYSVTNKGTAVMPFSIGAHPAFAMPGAFEWYSLKFEADEPLISTVLEDNLLTDKIIVLPAANGVLPLNYKLFENDALIFKTLRSKSVTIVKDGTDVLKVAFKDFPYLGIWTIENAPYLCIEPWQGYADAMNATGNLTEKEGTVLLDASAKYTAGFTVELF